MAHTTTIRVRFYELDPYNHVNHATYLQYFETARMEALTEIGLALTDLRDASRHVVVTDVVVKFRRPAVGGDSVTVETWTEELSRATATWGQRITRDGEVLCTASVRAAVTDETGRPLRFPADFANRLATLTPPD